MRKLLICCALMLAGCTDPAGDAAGNNADAAAPAESTNSGTPPAKLTELAPEAQRKRLAQAVQSTGHSCPSPSRAAY